MANNKKKVKSPSVIKHKGGATFIQMNKEFIAPITKVEQNYDYIRYGENNNYPALLSDLLASSGLHRAIIEKKVSLILGKGFDEDELDEKTLQFIAHPNPFEDLSSLLNKCAYDLETYGGYYLQIIKNPNNKEVDSVYHMAFDRMRVGLPNEFGFVQDYFYYPDLTLQVNQYSTIDQAVHFQAYSADMDMSEPSILFAKKYSITNKYYGSPIYEASVQDIQTYSEISNYHNSNLLNNFSPGFLLFFTGTPPSEELQDAIVGELKVKYSGTENTGSPMVFFLEDETQKPIIEAADQSNIDKQFESLIKQLITNIAISHQIPRQIVGIEDAGSLGNAKEILQATELFRTSIILPEQQTLLSVFNMIGAENGLGEIKIINPNPSILMYDMTDLMNILTQNELREWLGYEETEEIIEVVEKNNENIDE